MKGAVFWDIKTQLIPQRGSIYPKLKTRALLHFRKSAVLSSSRELPTRRVIPKETERSPEVCILKVFRN
jgi:hypothetical protein